MSSKIHFWMSRRHGCFHAHCTGLGAGPQETCCSEPGRPPPSCSLALPSAPLTYTPLIYAPLTCGPLTCALCPSYLYSQVKAASSKRFRTSLTPRVGWANIGFRGTPGMGERVR